MWHSLESNFAVSAQAIILNVFEIKLFKIVTSPKANELNLK